MQKKKKKIKRLREIVYHFDFCVLIFEIFQLIIDLLIYLWVYCLRHSSINPLHPNISMYILHTVLYTFPKVLTRRICLTIKSFF